MRKAITVLLAGLMITGFASCLGARSRNDNPPLRAPVADDRT